MKKLVLILMLPIQLAFGQEDIVLDSCYSWARNNYPNLHNSDLWSQIRSINQEYHKIEYLPQLILNGKVSYQSEVTSIPVSIPGVSVPVPSKDRYNAYAEIKQTIWDGGLAKMNRAMEDAVLRSNLSQLEVELYQLKTQVASSFFSLFHTKIQKEVLFAKKKVLKEQLKRVETSVSNGALEPSDAVSLKAELLMLQQSLFELEAAQEASLIALSILTGKTFDRSSELMLDPANSPLPDSIVYRPEIEQLRARSAQIETQKNLLTKGRNPRLFGFGQLGVGKPGLNFLEDELKGYYLLGVGISWNAFDWSGTSKQKEILQLQQEMLNNQEQTINQNIKLLLSSQSQLIIKLQHMIENDQELVNLRSDITRAATSKMENETITMSEYIRELEEETVATLMLRLHKVQLQEAKERYRILSGVN